MNVENATMHCAHRSRDITRVVNADGLRSDGVLTAKEARRCRELGIPLAFDPVQIGWVPVSRTDDIALPKAPDGQDAGLHFRPWAESDAPQLARMLSSESLWAFLPEEYPGRIDVATAFELIGLSRAPHHHVVAVVEDGRPVGQARLLFGSEGEAEISYWLGPDHWGKGLGSRIVRRFTEKCFAERDDLHRIFARVHEDNLASRRILERASYRSAGKDGLWDTLEIRR